MIICPTCGAQNPPGATTCSSCGTALQNLGAPASTPDSVALPRDSQLRNGNYIVGPVLGQGGFGITYKAGDMNLRRFVAIKEFFPFGAGRNRGTVQPTGGMTQASYEETKKKFLEEARTLARFNHPAIVRVYSVWEENNSAYMAMEFLEGKTLQKMVEEKGSIPEKAAVAHVKAVAEALESVHATGLIHRDIKPDNICVTNDGRTVLIDFGTARAFAAGKTVKQTAMLTPGYAPLEQYGQQARFGAFSDVYALGATLYHCLTGRMPAPATDRISGVEVQAPDQVNPSISPGVSRAVMHAMQIKAADRPQTMKEFVTELETPAVPKRPTALPLPGTTQMPPNMGVAQSPVAPPVPFPSAPASPLAGAGTYTATRAGEGQILTNAPANIALSAIWRGFSTFGVNNPTIDYNGGRVWGSTPLDLRSYGQNITGTVSQDAAGTLISIRSESGMPLNLTDFGRSRGEQRGLTEHVEQALLGAPPAGYMPNGLGAGMGSAPGQSYAPSPVAPIPSVAPSYTGAPYNPYGAGVGYGQHLPVRRGGEVITYALLSLTGFFTCGLGFIFAPIAWIRGNMALAEYGDQDPGDRGTVQAGRIIGISMTVLVGLVFVALFMVGLSN